MNEFLNTNVDGLALALALGIIGLVVLLLAAGLRLIFEPKPRQHFRHMDSVARAREQMGKDHKPIERPSYRPSNGWVDQRGEQPRRGRAVIR